MLLWEVFFLTNREMSYCMIEQDLQSLPISTNSSATLVAVRALVSENTAPISSAKPFPSSVEICTVNMKLSDICTHKTNTLHVHYTTYVYL